MKRDENGLSLLFDTKTTVEELSFAAFSQFANQIDIDGMKITIIA